jgi:hypothetical protein
MTPSQAAGVTTVVADLKNAYSASPAIQSWTRTLELSGDVLRVTDACSVAAGVTPIFQLQVPAAPVLQSDGTIRAGHLLVTPVTQVTAAVLAMNPAPQIGFTGGYRIDLVAESGCGFDVLLQAMPDAPPPPPGDDDGDDDDEEEEEDPDDTGGGPSPTPTPTCLLLRRSGRSGVGRARPGRDADQEPRAAHALHRGRGVPHPRRRARSRSVAVPAWTPAVRVSRHAGAVLRGRGARGLRDAQRQRHEPFTSIRRRLMPTRSR